MEVVGGVSGAEGVVRGLGGAVRARGRIGVLAGQDWPIQWAIRWRKRRR